MNFNLLKEISLSDQHKEQVQEFLSCWQNLMLKSIPVDLTAKQILFYQNHSPCGVYVLTSGKVTLFQENGSKKENMGLVRLNYPIGMDLIDNELVYPYTAEVVEPTKGFFVAKSDMTVCRIQSNDAFEPTI